MDKPETFFFFFNSQFPIVKQVNAGAEFGGKEPYNPAEVWDHKFEAKLN